MLNQYLKSIAHAFRVEEVFYLQNRLNVILHIVEFIQYAQGDEKMRLSGKPSHFQTEQLTSVHHISKIHIRGNILFTGLFIIILVYRVFMKTPYRAATVSRSSYFIDCIAVINGNNKPLL